ncbi:MAG: hypothetical protein GY855_16860 [candidate division Zixibacteria bacterium]|nr:hypothetical protein [candidate division Zixibacteria bacterium]
MSKSLYTIMIFGVIILTAVLGIASDDTIDESLAYQYFQEASVLSKIDNGRLWGVELYGPMMFVDPDNRTIAANYPDKEGILKRDGKVYRGVLPVEENIANTATSWAGLTWTMMVWPLPEDKYSRANLMMHELWHRIQSDIGFPASNSENNHLDKKEGRILIQLEWQALKEAINNDKKKRIDHLRNALIFRKYRRELYPDAASMERALEMNEGLAEYTGLALSGRDNESKIKHLIKVVDKTKDLPTFVRSFAYITGPLYGLLLDYSGIDWRAGLTKDNDLGGLLVDIYDIKISGRIEREYEASSMFYNANDIKKREDEREEKKRIVIEGLRNKFVTSSIVIIPLQDANLQFDPRNLQPLDDLGTVYPNIRISDNWGILTATNGALISSEWNRITVSALSINSESIKTTHIEGDGWTLELKDNWKLRPSERHGDYILYLITSCISE